MATTSKSPLPDDNPASQVRMTFGEHLEELRKRIVHALVGSVAGVLLCIYYCNAIVEFLVRPYRLALKVHHYPDIFQYTKPPEIVINYVTIGIQAGLILSSPWIIYQLWQFVGAGLFQRERKIIYKYIGPSIALFSLGVVFFYFLVLPVMLNFFVGFTDNTAISKPQPTRIEKLIGLDPVAKTLDLSKIPPGDKALIPPITVVSSDPPPPPEGSAYLYYDVTEGTMKLRVGKDIMTVMVVQSSSLFSNVPRFDEYLSFVMWSAIVFGLSFELPMVMLILAQIGMVMPVTFGRIRKYAYFGLMIASVIIAPSTDALSPLFLFVPLVGLYELGILAAKMVIKKREAAGS